MKHKLKNLTNNNRHQRSWLNLVFLQLFQQLKMLSQNMCQGVWSHVNVTNWNLFLNRVKINQLSLCRRIKEFSLSFCLSINLVSRPTFRSQMTVTTNLNLNSNLHLTESKNSGFSIWMFTRVYTPFLNQLIPPKLKWSAFRSLYLP